MDPRKNKHLHALLSQLNLLEMKADMVRRFTGGRTISSKDMTPAEVEAMIRVLEGEREDRCKKMRAKVIHYLCLYGMTLENGDPDFPRINHFIENIGSRNPGKKKLLFLGPRELHAVLNQVEMIYKKQLQKTHS